MPKNSLDRWEREFRRAAEADDLALCQGHLHRLGLSDKPRLLLHGTILAVHACCAYAHLDGRSTADFLEMQKYFPADVPDAKYAFTFDLCGRAFARIIVSAKLAVLDLADLYGHPWLEYKVCGYNRFWVSRIDGDDLSADELEHIQTEVTEDLRYDYSDDELDFWFDDESVEGVLQINLQDVERCEDGDPDEE